MAGDMPASQVSEQTGSPCHVMEREMTAEDGNRIVSRVEVGFTHLGTLSTEEQKLLYVLLKLWEDAGMVSTRHRFRSQHVHSRGCLA